MTRVSAAIVIVAAVVVMDTVRSHGDGLVTAQARPQFSHAPATVILTVRLDPHEDDRALRVEADSGAFFRSSEIQLDGADEPSAHSITFKSLPAGRYAVRVALQRGAGASATLSTDFIVIGHEREGESAGASRPGNE